MPPFGPRRPLGRAMMVGGTAYVASRAGAKAGAAKAEQQQQEEQQQAAAAAQSAAPTTEEKLAQIESLKRLLDEGALTQSEFDAQKQKLLAQL